MEREERQRVVRLESTLDKWAATEKRYLADLRLAGWDFASMDQARDYRRSLRSLDHMSRAELVEMVSRDKRRMAKERKAS